MAHGGSEPVRYIGDGQGNDRLAYVSASNELLTYDLTNHGYLFNIESAFQTEGNALGRGVLIQGDDGTDAKNVSVDATTGNLQVDASHAAAEGAALGKGILLQGDDGTDRKNVNVDATTGNLQVDAVNKVTVKGTVAHDGADGGDAPVKIGAKTEEMSSSPTSVADGDITDLLANRAGMLFMLGGHPNTQRKTSSISTATTTTVWDPATGKRAVITAVSVYADNGNTADADVEVKVGTTRISKHPGIAPGSGFVEGNGAGILAIGAVNDLVQAVTGAAQSVDVAVSGFEIE